MRQHLSLDDLIEGEIDTIMYSGAPQTVKEQAVKRRDVLIKQRTAARAHLEPHPKVDRYCTRCRGFGWLTYAEGNKAPCSCTVDQE